MSCFSQIGDGINLFILIKLMYVSCQNCDPCSYHEEDDLLPCSSVDVAELCTHCYVSQEWHKLHNDKEQQQSHFSSQDLQANQALVSFCHSTLYTSTREVK